MKMLITQVRWQTPTYPKKQMSICSRHFIVSRETERDIPEISQFFCDETNDEKIGHLKVGKRRTSSNQFESL